MAVAIATFEGMPPEFSDDRTLLAKLADRGIEAAYEPWNATGVDWDSFELIVNRTPWDYTLRYQDYIAWVKRVGARLENAAELIIWNADKHYLADLSEQGVPVVPTTYVGPGDPLPEISAKVVVKPAISGGARDTGQFGPGSADLGARLIKRICAEGRTAMVQPFIDGVDADGETAVVMIDGKLSHVLHKRAVLGADEIAPLRDDELGAAEAMYDPELVVPGRAETDQLELADRVIAAIGDRFGLTPLIARVDMLRDAGGSPVLLELEAIEPNLYFDQAAGSADRLADAIVGRARARSSP